MHSEAKGRLWELPDLLEKGLCWRQRQTGDGGLCVGRATLGVAQVHPLRKVPAPVRMRVQRARKRRKTTQLPSPGNCNHVSKPAPSMGRIT